MICPRLYDVDRINSRATSKDLDRMERDLAAYKVAVIKFECEREEMRQTLLFNGVFANCLLPLSSAIANVGRHMMNRELVIEHIVIYYQLSGIVMGLNRRILCYERVLYR